MHQHTNRGPYDSELYSREWLAASAFAAISFAIGGFGLAVVAILNISARNFLPGFSFLVVAVAGLLISFRFSRIFRTQWRRRTEEQRLISGKSHKP
jgi:hypothetical protein